MLYSYVKGAPVKPKHRLSKRHAKFLSVTFLFLGLILVGQVVVPIVGSYLVLLPEYSGEIVSPLASYFQPVAPPLAPKVAQADAGQKTGNYDSFRPSTWFATTNTAATGESGSLFTYTLSIPKLKIDKAVVEMGGDDLKKSLIAWPTSAVPGSYGVNIVFGHSELPSLATDPKNYSGIFTFLMDLNEGDEILVDSDGVHYKYIVMDKKVVDPTDLSVLEQRFDRAYLTLITCVPPGTLWKRGVVKARLVQS
ncbi:sortase [Candidatus Microgenomates bacterium]|nr:sortase [Candidatus Microgenomates bacterium]